jgi:hypothetical protein
MIQEPMIYSCSEPEESSPLTLKQFLKMYFIIILMSVLRSSEWSHLHMYCTESLLQYKITLNHMSQN